MVPSIQGHNAQVQVGIQTEEAFSEALCGLPESLDFLERVEATLDRVWEILCDVSLPTEMTHEWTVGNLDTMSEDLEVELGKLEVLPEDRVVLSEAREYLTRTLKVLKKSLEPLIGRVSLILDAVPMATREAFPDDRYRIACAVDDAIEVEATIMMSYAKCGICLLEVLQARNKVKQAVPESAQELARSLHTLAGALEAHAGFRDAYVESMDRVGLEIDKVMEVIDPREFKQEGVDFINNHLLKGISPATEEAFLQVNFDAFDFFIFLALYFYTTGPLKEAAIPSFFFRETKQKIQELRDKFSSVDVDFSIFKPILEDFEKFNSHPDSIKNCPLFTELKALSFGTLQKRSHRFMMCWQTVVYDRRSTMSSSVPTLKNWVWTILKAFATTQILIFRYIGTLGHRYFKLGLNKLKWPPR